MAQNKKIKSLLTKDQQQWTKKMQDEEIERREKTLSQSSSEVVKLNEDPLIKDPPELHEHWEILMQGLPEDPDAWKEYLNKALKHHKRYKKSFDDEIIAGKHSNIGEGPRESHWTPLHDLFNRFDLDLEKERKSIQKPEQVSKVLRSRLEDKKQKKEIDQKSLIRQVADKDDRIIWKNPETGKVDQLQWDTVSKTIRDLRKKRKSTSPPKFLSS